MKLTKILKNSWKVLPVGSAVNFVKSENKKFRKGQKSTNKIFCLKALGHSTYGAIGSGITYHYLNKILG